MAPITANLAGMVSSRPQAAAVSYGNGLLDVRANNSSLNAILREVARETGMKLTGSVADQRVFGNYGPAAPATVLATLLDGTGSNMLLREAADLAPAELILTPRTGGPSPPSAGTDEANSGSEPVQRVDAPINAPAGDLSRQQRMGGATRAFGQSTPIGFPTQLQTNQADGQNAGFSGSSTDANVANGMNANGNGTTRSSTGTAPAANANGDPKTPEQVYQLLQQLRQQSIQEQNGKQQ